MSLGYIYMYTGIHAYVWRKECYIIHVYIYLYEYLSMYIYNYTHFFSEMIFNPMLYTDKYLRDSYCHTLRIYISL